MIAYLEGRLLYVGADYAVIVVQGVGYQVYLAAGMLAALVEGQEAALHIYQVVREDHTALYGFSKREERELFLRVLSVSGIGPKIALAITGSGDAGKVASQIVSEDLDALLRIPGIGKKTAQRMTMELKDKLEDLAVNSERNPAGIAEKTKTSVQNISADLLETLLSLGYGEREARGAIRHLREQIEQGMPFEDLVRSALRHLTNV